MATLCGRRRKLSKKVKCIYYFLNVNSGFVEVRFETHSEIDFKVISLNESPAERMRKSMLKAGITQEDFFKQNFE